MSYHHLIGRIFHDFKIIWNLDTNLSCEDACAEWGFVQLLCHIHLAGRVFAMQALLYKCGITWPTLGLVLLSYAVVMQPLYRRCGFALLLWCFRCCCCCAGPLWPVYDLCPCRSSCSPPAAGHWATFTPLTGLLSTLLFLPLDSSIFLTKLSHRSSTLFLLLSFISTWFFF